MVNVVGVAAEGVENAAEGETKSCGTEEDREGEDVAFSHIGIAAGVERVVGSDIAKERNARSNEEGGA